MSHGLVRLRVVLAVLLALSAGGFALAAQVERSREKSAARVSTAPEGSVAREAAERGSSAAPLPTATTGVAPTSVAPAAGPEGSPSREAAERSGRSESTPTAPASLPSTASPP